MKDELRHDIVQRWQQGRGRDGDSVSWRAPGILPGPGGHLYFFCEYEYFWVSPPLATIYIHSYRDFMVPNFL